MAEPIVVRLIADRRQAGVAAGDASPAQRRQPWSGALHCARGS
jgi:hypothetical protein